MASATGKRIGQRIRALRKEAGYTLEELAERIGLSSGKYLGQIERGEANCTIETLEKVAGGVGKTVEDFFPGEQDEDLARILDLLSAQSRKMRGKIRRMLEELLS